MNRYTIQFGTCESNDGVKEKLYVTQPDLYIDEFNKQKASFKNPNATDESIKRIAERVVDSRVVCKLGQYEDIDESPERLAKIKQALEIIAKKEVDIYGIKNSIDVYDYNAGIENEDNFENRMLIEEEYSLVKEVLL